ncbi:MAG: class I SAM-dependent methyltransferase [Elusimicrobia bacterium]|nr:class I SAM-dependent methyltransferase [Elusimicrobiota bacterium]
MAQELFDLSAEYDRMLNQGLMVTGESKDFFARGRLADLKATLPPGFSPSAVLDFGCGTGGTTRALAQAFPAAEVTGTDTAQNALAYAREHVGVPNARFVTPDRLEASRYDLAYVNGVFHHIEARNRVAAAKLVYDALRPGGRFAFFDNNPWNPGTRLLHRLVPFDRDATFVYVSDARRILAEAGFDQLAPARFLFIFPRALASLRFLEGPLASLPFGAQYHIDAVK